MKYFSKTSQIVKKIENTSEILWFIFRSILRDIVNVPVQIEKFDRQDIQTGYNNSSRLGRQKWINPNILLTRLTLYLQR